MMIPEMPPKKDFWADLGVRNAGIIALISLGVFFSMIAALQRNLW